MAYVTIKDLATKLNISHSTVSRALRDHPDVNKETKSRVLSMAKEMEYHPDTIAQSLKRQVSTTIGVMVPQVKHFFFAALMSGITDVMSKAGYTVMVCQSDEDYEQEVNNTRTLISQRIAGVLISVSKSTRNMDHFKLLQKRGIPIVFFDRVGIGIEANQVVFDDYQGAFHAVEHLIEQGYKQIAHLGGPENLLIAQNRLKGYRDALKKHGLPLDENRVVYCGLNEEDGIAGFDTLIQQTKGEVDAIFGITDPVTLGAFRRMREKKLRIPDDIALVGFSNSPETSLVDPSLTTVSQSAPLMGETAARLLLKQIKGSDSSTTSFETVVLKTDLIIRESSIRRSS